MIKKFNSKHGFTLLELMSIVVIIGILAAIGIPTFDSAIKKVRFKADSNVLLSGLRKARSQAISKRMQCGVSFDTLNNVFSIFEDQNSPENFTFDVGDSVIAVDTLGRGMQAMTTTFADNLVFFFPDGTASMSGTVNGTATWTGTDTALVQISVLAATGRVKMESLTF
jgi:prepilin-type N-terminal cleavage/methylation domain-containing protein